MHDSVESSTSLPGGKETVYGVVQVFTQSASQLSWLGYRQEVQVSQLTLKRYRGAPFFFEMAFYFVCFFFFVRKTKVERLGWKLN